MADPITDSNLLIYAFGLFFIFFVLVVLIIRYSNKELVKKFATIYEKLKLTEKDMRKLAETEMRAKSELKKEIDDMKTELQEIKENVLPKNSPRQKNEALKETSKITRA